MAAHTPGPWRASGKAGYTGHSVVDADGRSVAAFPSTSKRPKGERDANARLIAAAPDLLEALRNFTDGRDISYTDALVAARAVLSKLMEAA